MLSAIQITSSFRIAGGVVTTCNHLTPSPRGKVKRPRSEASPDHLPRWQGRVIRGSACLPALQHRHVLDKPAHAQNTDSIVKQPPLRSWPLSSDTGSRQKSLLGYAPLEHLLPAQCFKRTALVTISSSASGDTGRRPVASKLTFAFLRRIATSECACPCTVHSNPSRAAHRASLSV